MSALGAAFHHQASRVRELECVVADLTIEAKKLRAQRDRLLQGLRAIQELSVEGGAHHTAAGNAIAEAGVEL